MGYNEDYWMTLLKAFIFAFWVVPVCFCLLLALLIFVVGYFII